MMLEAITPVAWSLVVLERVDAQRLEPRRPGRAAAASSIESAMPLRGRSASVSPRQTVPTKVKSAATSAAIAAPLAWRASQASWSSVPTAATRRWIVAGRIRPGRAAAQRRADLGAQAAARGLGFDLVAAGDARDAVARGEHEVEQRRGEPDAAPRSGAGWRAGSGCGRPSARESRPVA